MGMAGSNSGGFQAATIGKDLRFNARTWRSTRILVLPALLRYHICLRHVYLYLLSCYFKVSSSAMTHIAPIHENINNWSPPVEYVALYVDMLALEGVFFSVVCMALYLPSRADVQIEAFWEQGQQLCQQSLLRKKKSSARQNSALRPCCVYWFLVSAAPHVNVTGTKRANRSCPDHPR